MNNFALFILGLAITLIAGMGIATSQVIVAYKKHLLSKRDRFSVSKVEI